MILSHYSPDPIEFDATREYVQETEVGFYIKPTGLWLSDDSDLGWKQFSIENHFNVESIEHETRFEVDVARILHLDHHAAMVAFTERYEVAGEKRSHPRYVSIDWPCVVREYDGILISPYQWKSRMDLMWYYGWDVASACIWNLAALRLVEPSVTPTLERS